VAFWRGLTSDYDCRSLSQRVSYAEEKLYSRERKSRYHVT
jgi:hypothetical protein